MSEDQVGVEHFETEQDYLPSESQLVLLCLDYLRDLRRAYPDKQDLLDAEGLPELDADHDYQLWADVEGEMIDMGVIAANDPTQVMNYIPMAESMNITIEPKGGSDHPTVSNLIASIVMTP